ncbi:Alpha-2-macroglobulin receptor-associated protein [Bos mutus]|uniref:Alpha-2-macroglobulin receptor-associated protein n=1 Tax=Bos mutus TaxID=72004 RepID=L8IL81_9CETA|nr:Alpha-2-macroglobulin receptor-associated protein [Bos mutus]
MASRRVLSGLRAVRQPPPPLLLLLLLLGPWAAAGHAGKYSREKNEPAPPSKREPAAEFRMEKLNQLWEKAQRLNLPPLKLSDLHTDLKIQERDEFKWKKLKAEGLDEDGEEEAKLVRSLSVILAKYGLDGRKDSRVVSSNFVDHGPDDESLEDPRLEKLWHKAKTSGKFSSEELDKLWRELQHHKEKVQEYHALLETLGGAEGAAHRVAPPAGALPAASGSRRGLQGRGGELATWPTCSQLPPGLEGGVTARLHSRAEFTEPRVLDLWDMAKSANFTEKELESFREELKHFEVKIEKHNHYQKQLEISHQKLKHVESFGDQQHVTRNRERYATLEERTKELGYKVKKHMQDLSSRISRARHNEL